MDEYDIANARAIPTPALVVYRERVAENIRRVGDLLGGFLRLRPHIKTHKMSRVARMQMDAGIDKFKCATPKEAALLAAVGASDILISYHIIGPAADRVVAVRSTYPKVDLKVIADDEGAVRDLSAACVEGGTTLGVMVDVNTGMDRTGVLPGEPSLALARTIAELPGLVFAGLHVYDGHASGPDANIRRQTALESIGRAVETRRLIDTDGLEVRSLVASGSPAFESTATVPEVDEVSPGTWIFWDLNYENQMPGKFRWAALVLSRVISTPGLDLITLDAGSKTISPDTPVPYFRPLGFPEGAEFLRRNEEHQVLRVPPGMPRPSVGDLMYLVPRHVCTTVNLWDEACVIDATGNFVETWPVDARGH